MFQGKDFIDVSQGNISHLSVTFQVQRALVQLSKLPKFCLSQNSPQVPKLYPIKVFKDSVKV